MLLSTQTDVLGARYPENEAIRILASCGFDAYDMSLFYLAGDSHVLCSEKYKEYAKRLRDEADNVGIICNQAHAPFPTGVGKEPDDENIFKKVVRSMEIASILGARNIVVHPKQHLVYADNAEKLFELNVEFYKRLIPYCQEFNIRVAVENMWQRNPNTYSVYDSTCSRAWEFCKYIDAIDSPWIIGCLDIGHVSLVGADIPEFIHTLGNKRLVALHVHDTDLRSDLHTLPYTQKINFDAVAKALGEIDYQGDITYEADNFIRGLPKEVLPQAESLMCAIGRHMINVVEENRPRTK